jgi:hypothetical protein
VGVKAAGQNESRAFSDSRMGCPRPAAVLNHPLALPQGDRGIWPALTSSSICGHGEQEILDCDRICARRCYGEGNATSATC